MEILTIRGFSQKHRWPEHLVRSLVKQGRCPGFQQGNRFYILEDRALQALANMSNTNDINKEVS